MHFIYFLRLYVVVIHLLTTCPWFCCILFYISTSLCSYSCQLWVLSRLQNSQTIILDKSFSLFVRVLLKICIAREQVIVFHTCHISQNPSVILGLLASRKVNNNFALRLRLTCSRWRQCPCGSFSLGSVLGWLEALPNINPALGLEVLSLPDWMVFLTSN